METMLTTIVAQVAPVFLALVTTLVSIGLVRLNRWIKAKGGSEAALAVDQVVSSTINELNATIVKDVRAAAADGKLTRQEAMEIKDRAVSQVMGQLPPAVAKTAIGVLGDLEAFVRGKVEEKVAGAK